MARKAEAEMQTTPRVGQPESKPSAWQYDRAVAFDAEQIYGNLSVFNPPFVPEGIEIAFALHPNRDMGREFTALQRRGFTPVNKDQVTTDYDEGVRNNLIVLRFYRLTPDSRVMPTEEHILMWRPLWVRDKELERHREYLDSMNRPGGEEVIQEEEDELRELMLRGE